MLRGTNESGDVSLEQCFHHAFFEAHRLNESLISKDNAISNSGKAIQSRTSADAMLPLRQQIVLLSAFLDEHPNDKPALDLFESLTREYALSSLKHTQLVSNPNASAQISRFWQSIEGFDRDLAEEHLNDLNMQFESLLKPPKPAAPTAANNAHPVMADHANTPKTSSASSAFVTAKSMMPAGGAGLGTKPTQAAGPKSLGVNKRPRLAPSGGAKNNQDLDEISNNYGYYNQKPAAPAPKAKAPEPEEPVDERLAGIEGKLIELIKNEIQYRVDHVSWEDIAGLEHAKNTIKEIVIWPMLRPDIFTGLRGPPKGLLLFGPPGTGKTLIGKCIANQAKATFFSISASSLTSKWVGEGEKLVRALFAVARVSQPSVIFIDEIDSLLSQRNEGEFEASRRIKTEFLVQFDGASTSSEDRILVIGATNRPQEIDEAARRRLVKRLYIPLPDGAARVQIVRNLLAGQKHGITEDDLSVICQRTDGYSGSDMANLCREAAVSPMRSITDILNIDQKDVPPILLVDFEKALTQVRASVSPSDLAFYLDWNKQFGSIG